MLLALDIGTKRTGVALADRSSGVIIALDTIQHASPDELVQKISDLVTEKHVDELVVGHPLLLSGEEGAQVKYVQGILEMLREVISSPILLLDERYTSASVLPCKDPDARSACTLAELALQRPKESV